jgi:hypothetical protein
MFFFYGYSWEDLAHHQVYVWQFWQHLSGKRSFSEAVMKFVDSNSKCVLLEAFNMKYFSVYMTCEAMQLLIYQIIFPQATIGIDFLSKTMYLEDRTVSRHGSV